MNTKGFTLIEMLIVLFIISILGAIAAPSWLSFMNQQRVNAANESVLRALREAQETAKIKKRNYSVSFKTESGIPKFAIHLKNEIPADWKNLGGELNIDSKQLLLGTNLVAENVGSSSTIYNSETPQKITFDSRGTLMPLPNNDYFRIITTAILQSNGSTMPINSTRRCVRVKTILGAMDLELVNNCNP